MRTKYGVSARLRQSQRMIGKYIIVDFRYNNRDVTRLGLTVTKKFGRAYQRNRFKRITREAFRVSYPSLNQAWI